MVKLNVRKPNFFVVGAPKSGTTALCEYLRVHPEVFFSTPKEPQYFASDFHNAGAITNLLDYMGLFKNVSSCHKVIAEGSTKYFRSSEAIERIESFSPGAKYLVMLRNPLDMVASLHEQVLFNGEEDVDKFEDAWNLQEKRRNGLAIPKGCQEPLDLQYGYFCLLGEQLERLYNKVGANRVKVVFYDDFAEDNSAIYSDVLDFLNLSSFSLPAFKRINQGKRIRFGMVKKITRLAGNVKRYFGIKRRFGITTSIDMLNSTSSYRPQMSSKFRIELMNYFQEDIDLLSKITNRDLGCWIAK